MLINFLVLSHCNCVNFVEDPFLTGVDANRTASCFVLKVLRSVLPECLFYIIVACRIIEGRNCGIMFLTFYVLNNFEILETETGNSLGKFKPR